MEERTSAQTIGCYFFKKMTGGYGMEPREREEKQREIDNYISTISNTGRYSNDVIALVKKDMELMWRRRLLIWVFRWRVF